MRIDPTTGIRHLTIAAVLCLALGPAGAQQQGQQGGFAPSPNQQPQSPQQPEPEPPPGAQPVPFEAELERALPSDRRIATAGGLIWDCKDDLCRAEGAPPQGQSQTVRLCGDLTRRAGPITGLSVAGNAVGSRLLDRCNQAARFAGQVPEPERPGGQQGGFVPTPDGGELPEGAETADLDENTLTIVGPEVEGDRAVAVEVPDGSDASAQFLLGHPENEAGTEGILLLVSRAPFVGDCARSDFTSDESRGFVAGVPAGSTALDLSGTDLRPGPTYYVRGCPVTGDAGRISGPPTNTVEMTVLATVAPGGIATELPGFNVLTVNGEGARANLLLREGVDRVREADLPTFSYNFAHRDSADATAGFIEIKETPFDSDTCPEYVDPDGRILPTAAGYHEGPSVSDEPLAVLRERAVPDTYYVRACPIAEDGDGPYWAGPPTNVVQVSFGPGPDVEMVSAVPNVRGPAAFHVGPGGGFYEFNVTLVNHGSTRTPPLGLGYFYSVDRNKFYKAGVASGDTEALDAGLEPGESATVQATLAFNDTLMGDRVMAKIRRHGAVNLYLFVTPAAVADRPPSDWTYVDANESNNGLWRDVEVERRLEVRLGVPFVARVGGECRDWVFNRTPEVLMSIGVGGDWLGDRSKTFDFRGDPYSVNLETGFIDLEPDDALHITIWLHRDGSSRTFAYYHFDIPPEEWLVGGYQQTMNGTREEACEPNTFALRLTYEPRMRSPR